jgi:hypothetical protein
VFPVGTTTVTCRAIDDCQNVASCEFRVTVIRDVEPPTIICPSNLVVESCVAGGVVVNYPKPVVRDDCDTNVTVVCTPPSGNAFPPGVTTVTCRAIDDCQNVRSCEFTVTVRSDTEPPKITCPSNIVVWTCATTGTAVNYPPPLATDNTDTNLTIVCTPSSGSVFPVGTTTVTCRAIDDCQNVASCEFRVTVIRDVEPPIIRCPSNIVAEGCSAAGVIVNYPRPEVRDDCDTNVTVVCTPPSGSAFQPGVTVVICRAIDDCQNVRACEFTVTVRGQDTEPPKLICPEVLVFWTCESNGMVVNYTVVVSDNTDPTPTVTCIPPPGSLFPVGVTPVQCRAVDDCGNVSECQFAIRVIRDQKPPTLQCPSNMLVTTCDDQATVTYRVSATDDCDTNVTIICAPPSGSVLPVGTNAVSCLATDDCGQGVKCTFMVVVRQAPPKLTIRKVQLAGAVGVLICWPADCEGYRLQCSTNLHPPIGWVTVTNPVVIINGSNCVFLPGLHKAFYRLRKPSTPVITSVSPLRARAGDVLMIEGRGFGESAEDLCAVIVEQDPGSAAATEGGSATAGTHGGRYLPLRVLHAQDNFITARMGPVPPDARPGPIMVGHGIGQVGRFQTIFPDIVQEAPTWTWRKFGPAGVGEQIVQPVPTPPPTNEWWYFSGPPMDGALCLYIQGNWPSNAFVSVVARAHDSVSGTGGYDLDGPTYRFIGGGTTRDCVERIADILRCAFLSQAGVVIEVTIEEVPAGSGVFKITVRIPGGYIDRGILNVCVSAPAQPVITGFTPQEGTEGTLVTVRGTNFPTDPNDICMVVMDGDSPRYIPFDVLESGPNAIVARLGPVPPDAKPGRIMIGLGEGQQGRFRPAFFDVFVADDVWTWNRRGPVAMGPGVFAPRPRPPQNAVWFFSGPPEDGVLCVYLRGNWAGNSTVSVVARAHDNVTGAGGHDLAAPKVVLLGEGPLLECARRIADILRCAFLQQAGVNVQVQLVPQSDGSVKLVVSIAGGYIDRGMLTICVSPPPR